jgi:hypothetical protein
MSTLANAAEEVLKQGLVLLSQIDEETYALVAPEPYNASLGRHYRHVLDHFHCLEIGAARGVIDYDNRVRDARLENDVEYARAETERLIGVFKNCSDELLEEPCVVQYSVGYIEKEPARVLSVLGRELAFCVGHAVHHYAIVRLLCDALEIGVVPEFGVAPSTLKHRMAHAAN